MLVAPMPKRREMIFTSSGWETSLGILFLVLDSIPVSVHDAGHEIGLELVVEVVIHLNRRCQATSADAFNLFQREEAVGGNAIGSDAELFAKTLVDFVSSAEHATDVGTNLDVVFAGGLEAKHGVVGGDVAHLKLGDANAAGNFGDDRIGEIANFVLRVEQHGDEKIGRAS